ncbi:hypothetical protein WEI85_39025 [Actinomycetes bacterium KLBMP 9797]
MSNEAEDSMTLAEGLGLRVQRDTAASAAPERLFRLPGHGDPAPPTARLATMSSWAAALGLIGMLVVVRALMAVFGGPVPWWYEPALIGAGLLGIGLTVGAFMSIQHRRLPWCLLATATLPLLAALVLTVVI